MYLLLNTSYKNVMGGFFFYPEEDYQYKRESEIKEYKLTADRNGNIIVPDKLKKRLGLKEGSELRAVIRKDRIGLYPDIHSLSKIYIEPTTLCNLKCQTCVRNTWNETLGEMRIDIFDSLIICNL